MHSSSSTANGGTATLGVRTWRRTSADRALPLDARVEETTDPADMGAALSGADFVTIPRAEGVEPGAVGGYDDPYAQAFAVGLAERYGYSGAIRTSTSGRSYVFEREAAFGGAVVDLGVVPAPPSGPPPVAPTGSPYVNQAVRRVTPPPALMRARVAPAAANGAA